MCHTASAKCSPLILSVSVLRFLYVILFLTVLSLFQVRHLPSLCPSSCVITCPDVFHLCLIVSPPVCLRSLSPPPSLPVRLRLSSIPALFFLELLVYSGFLTFARVPRLCLCLTLCVIVCLSGLITCVPNPFWLKHLLWDLRPAFWVHPLYVPNNLSSCNFYHEA